MSDLPTRISEAFAAGEPDPADVDEAIELLDQLGIVVAPGPFFGPGGEGHVRAALVPTLEECLRAAELLASWA